MIIRRPITQEQIKKMEARTKPTQEDIQEATDNLFMYLLRKVEELEAGQGGGDSPTEKVSKLKKSRTSKPRRLIFFYADS